MLYSPGSSGWFPLGNLAVCQLQTPWDLVKEGKVSGKRLIISPNVE